ncbi:MAG: WG repeat-containing protein [Clostridia bacterium]|nr:WG repeat-containing protein [Clostridia bacterium]
MNLKIKLAAVAITIVFFLSGISMLFMEYVQYRDETEARRLALEEKQQQEAELAEKLAYEAALEEDRLAALVKYDSVGDYYNGRAVVKLDGKYGVIDENSNAIIETIYDEIENFTMEKYTRVKKDGKWGYISRNGNILIPTEYYFCGKPYENIVIVGNNGRYGYMNMDGTKVTDLLYDKVENFGDNGLGKVILNQLFGYVDKNGKVIVPITTPYIDENADFVGTWNRTEVHSGEASQIIITNQTANTFEFTLTSKYFTKQGTVSDMADIVQPTVGEYVFEGTANREVIRFERIEDYLLVTSNLSGNIGFDKEVNVLGKYVLGEPVYNNAETLHQVFRQQEVLNKILTVLGEELYEDIFLLCVNEGLYETENLNDKSLTIKGRYYYFYIPTTGKAFKLVIAKETGYIYFQARSNDAYTYKTDDPNRQNRAISAVSFDEVLD